MTFGVVATESRPHELGPIGDSYAVVVSTNDVIHTRVNVGATQNHLSQLFTVSTSDSNRDGQFFCRLDGHTDIIDAKIGVGADDGSRTEVHTLSGKVASETSFLALEALCERLQRATRTVTSGWDASRLVVEIGRDVILQQFPQILNNELGGTSITILSQALIDSKNVHKFVSKVILTSVTTIQSNGWTDRDWWYRKYAHDDPFGTTCVFIHANENQISIWDSFKPFSDVTSIQLVFALVHLLLFESGGFVELDLALFGTTVHTDCTLGTRTNLDNLFDDFAEFG